MYYVLYVETKRCSLSTMYKIYCDVYTILNSKHKHGKSVILLVIEMYE